MSHKKVLIIGGSGFIGSHLCRFLLSKKVEIAILDVSAPSEELIPYWREGTILNSVNLDNEVIKNNYDVIINLAAFTSMYSENEKDYDVNTIGVFNLTNAIERHSPKTHLIHFSTQHVIAPGEKHMKDFRGKGFVGDYGKSKREGELILQESKIEKWIIFRPTLIWGPGNTSILNGIGKALIKRYYFHVKNDSVVRSYGYIENSVQQIWKVVDNWKVVSNKNTYYLADGNFSQLEWVTLLSKSLVGREPKKISIEAIQTLAKIGDILKRVGLNFPMDTSRYKNMTTSNYVPLEDTKRDLGIRTDNYDSGILETAEWIKLKIEGKKNDEEY
jgi:nucleoside-diphosphate-sugar epimerase